MFWWLNYFKLITGEEKRSIYCKKKKSLTSFSFGLELFLSFSSLTLYSVECLAFWASLSFMNFPGGLKPRVIKWLLQGHIQRAAASDLKPPFPVSRLPSSAYSLQPLCRKPSRDEVFFLGNKHKKPLLNFKLTFLPFLSSCVSKVWESTLGMPIPETIKTKKSLCWS